MKAKAESEHDEGMLEYLEDIIGTNKFKEPIENAEKEVEELNEKRGEKVIYKYNLQWMYRLVRFQKYYDFSFLIFEHAFNI